LTSSRSLQRPRSKRAHDKVVEAAIELLAENGIEGTSIDAIAAVSGVSKATIYKHWADKNALCLEAIGRVHGLDLDRPKFESGNLLQDIIDFLNQRPPAEFSKQRERLMPHVVGYAASNPEFGKAWRSMVLDPSRAQLTELVGRGISEGRFAADLDVTLAIAMLMGPIMYTKIFGSCTSVPKNLAESVAGAFWRAFARSSAADSRR
jgi:AcrR family transcriptional regulator